MKTKNFLLCALLLGSLGLYGQVKIGDNPQTIDLGSLLELESSDKALVVSRVTTAQMNGIMPLEGAIVFNTDVSCLFYYDGLQWNNMCDELPIEFATDPIVNTAETIVITQNGDIFNFEVGQISSENIVDFSIAGVDIQNNTITDEKLAANSVGTEELQDNTITDLEMDYTAVTLADFTNDAGYITAANIVSADAGNNVTTGTDGGAYFNAQPFEIAISQIETDLDLKEDVANKSTDVALGNSDILYPSQNAVKTYVDNVVGGSAQTIVSTDGGNNITAGSDGGAYLNITPLENQVTTIQGDLNAHITADGDLDDQNELITNAQLIGTDLQITDAGQTWTVPLGGLGGGGGSTEVADQITIVGVGSGADPFRVADGGIGTAQLANAAVTPVKVEPSATDGQVLTTSGGAVVWADPTGGGGNQDLNSVLTQGNDAGTQGIVNLADPVQPQDAATKAYVDAVAGGGAVEVADQITIVGVGTGADPFRVADGGITSLQLADDAVTSAKILDGEVQSADIADNAVVTAKIPDGAVTEVKINPGVDGQVLTTVAGVPAWAAPSGGGAVLADNSTITGDGTVGNELQVVDGGINTLQLADNAVTSAKILDGEVQTADIADNNVTPAKIAQGADGQVLYTDGAGDVIWTDLSAADVSYDNTTSGLTATDTQAAIDEIAAAGGSIPNDELITSAQLSGNTLEITEAGVVWPVDLTPLLGTDDQLAAEVPYDPTASGLTATDTQAAIDEIAALSGAAGVPNGVFFAEDPTGVPITDAEAFQWDPTKRSNSGALGIGLDNTDVDFADYSKVMISEQQGGSQGPAYPLFLHNASSNFTAGTSVGVLFGVDFPTEYAKAALVFERTSVDWARGSIHLLNNNDVGPDLPTLADAALTVDFDRNVGIGTTAPQNKLHVAGQTRSEGFASSDGTANEPAYSFWDDSNTGMYRAAADQLGLVTGGVESLRIDASQQVGIGVTAPVALLHVGGTAQFDGTVTFSDGSTIPDYVFQKYFEGSSKLDPNYNMLNLNEVSDFIRKHHHLPGVQSALEVAEQGGVNAGKMLLSNLEKIEELFLHTIEQQEEIQNLKSENESLKNSLEEMKARMDRMESLLLKKSKG